MKSEENRITVNAFEDYLRKRGYSEYTPSGKQSTVFDYAKRIRKVCEWENLKDLNELAEKIHDIVPKYDEGGERADDGAKSHKAYINALKRFREFIG